MGGALDHPTNQAAAAVPISIREETLETLLHQVAIETAATIIMIRGLHIIAIKDKEEALAMTSVEPIVTTGATLTIRAAAATITSPERIDLRRE